MKSMINHPLRCLIVDDNPDDRTLTRRALSNEFPHLEAEEITEAQALEQALEAGNFDLVVTDYRIGWTDGLQVLRAVKSRYPEHPVVMFTNTGTEETAVEAMKSGLDDYVIKSPKHFIRLPIAVRAAWERAEARRQSALMEVRLQGLLNRVNVGVFRCTLEGILLECNPAFLRLLNIADAEQIKGTDFYTRYFPTQDRQELLNRLRQSGMPVERDAEVRRDDNSLIWVTLNETVGQVDGNAIIDGLMEDATARRRAQEVTAWQRDFVKEVLFSVTEGRLNLCDSASDLPVRLLPASEPIELTRPTLRHLRHAARRAASAQGHPPERCHDLETAVGEAAMNAVVHAGTGRGGVCADESGLVQVWIEDAGAGIDVGRLHRATLEKGFTTAGSLGHGFWMILNVVDRVWLLTGPEGTTVVLEQERVAPEPPW